ncbi:fasciclin-like arabinogalactan protein 14 [Cornus florida]|uniref:fasciclin-like arabinogalactan protein 14 n=1 Tax=Cornus florida TaxID=4283 RepID=UPI0028981B90|nr:fasciclin-like arabinogalactan protein 14 [Cornus florida]
MSSFAQPSFLLFSSFLLLSSTATAFNITNILSKNPEFSNFNQYLNETGLNREINRRSTITVLAVSNGAVSSISDKSTDLIKSILSNHIVLDYYDIPKLQKLKGKSEILTTLYQSSGVANNRQGFLNVTNLGNGNIVFGSAVKGAPLDAKLVKLVASQPFNISVIEVSSVIVAPGIDGNFTAPPPMMTPAPAPSPLRAKAPRKANAPKKAQAPEVESPVDEGSDDTTPSEAPAPSPTPDSAPPKSDTPAADAPATEDATAPASPASRAVLSAGGVMGLVLALTVVFLKF